MKGILFKPESIKAIFEGRKTQTRRLGGLKEINKSPDDYSKPFPSYDGTWGFHCGGYMDKIVYAKPRYQVGETVYIKEAWDYLCGKTPEEITLLYKANYSEGTRLPCDWRTPLFMPEWAARHFITITDVRAERLQEIRLTDIFAEGCPAKKADYSIDPAEGYYLQNDAYEWFVYIWDPINKDYPWEMNPWVWVYTFRLKESNNAK